MPITYFIDSINGDNINDGSTPALAMADMSPIPEDNASLAGGQIVYIRQGSSFTNPATKNIGKFELYGWDASDGNRPQAGIAAGWDGDNSARPVFNMNIASAKVLNIGSSYVGEHVVTVENIHIVQTGQYATLIDAYEPILKVKNILWDANGEGARMVKLKTKDTNSGQGPNVTIEDSRFNATSNGSASNTLDILFHTDGSPARPRTYTMRNVQAYGMKNIVYSAHNNGYDFNGSTLLVEDCDLTIGGYSVFCNGEYGGLTGWFKVDIIRSTIVGLSNTGLFHSHSANFYGIPLDVSVLDSQITLQHSLAGNGAHHGTRLKLSMIGSSMTGSSNTIGLFVTESSRSRYLHGFQCINSTLSSIPCITHDATVTSKSKIYGDIEIRGTTFNSCPLLFKSASITGDYNNTIELSGQLMDQIFHETNVSALDLTIHDNIISKRISERAINNSTISINGSSVAGVIKGNNTQIIAIGSKFSGLYLEGTSSRFEMCEVAGPSSGAALSKGGNILAKRTIISSGDIGTASIFLLNTRLNSIDHPKIEITNRVATLTDPSITVDSNPVESMTYDGKGRSMLFSIQGKSINNATPTVFKFLVETAHKSLFGATDVFYPTSVGVLEKHTVSIIDGNLADWINPPAGFSPLEINFDKSTLAQIPANYTVSVNIAAKNIDATTVYKQK